MRRTLIQSFIFNKNPYNGRKVWTPQTAKRWLLDHGFLAYKVDIRVNTIRFRQFTPHRNKAKYRYRTIRFGDGIEAVIEIKIR